MPKDLSSRIERYWHDRHLGSFSEATRMLIENSLTSDASRYFPKTSLLVDRGPQRQLRVPGVPLLYMRLIPTTAVGPIRRADALDCARALEPFYYKPTITSFEPNEYGAIAFTADHNSGHILAAAQIFLNREIWAFNATLFDPDSRQKRGIPTGSVEQTLAVMLPKYLRVARDTLGIEGPVRIEAGAVGLKGYVLLMPPDNFGQREWGPLQQDHVRWSGILSTDDPGSRDEALLAIFDEFFDAAGLRRPEKLYHFPGETPGALPKL